MLDVTGDDSEKIRKENKLARELDDKALQWVMSAEPGRRLIARLLLRAGLATDPFNTNALVMAKSVGAQSMMRPVFNDLLRVCQAQYFQMIQEQKNGDEKKGKINQSKSDTAEDASTA